MSLDSRVSTMANEENMDLEVHLRPSKAIVGITIFAEVRRRGGQRIDDREMPQFEWCLQHVNASEKSDWSTLSFGNSYVPTPSTLGKVLGLRLGHGGRVVHISAPVIRGISLPERFLFGTSDRLPHECNNSRIISVMSYNISSHRHTWDSRWQKLSKEIFTHKANIICLQEVDREKYNNVMEPTFFNRGYSGVFIERTRIGTEPLDGCATFYHRHLFEMIDYTTVYLERDMKQYVKRFGTPELKASTSKWKKGNIASILRLKLINIDNEPEPRYIFVVNTHISQSNPRNPGAVETLRLLQVATIRKHLVEYVCNQDAPILFCGDLNSMNNRKLGNAQWSILEEGIYSTFRLRNSYEPTRGNAPGPYTDRKIIDYIFYFEDHFEVIDCLCLPNLRGKNAPDSEDFWKRGSDHILMLSRFFFRPLRQNGIT
ncbi:hypothetical protein H6P81_000403 [Aristolochia fimbriata]|uniref:Endonuclease/exonuclease/phosphatase domain-containing protein n=1 Tax=Aristolochia fimbriata TaxID=158543 RepID=A0AAV7F403_ARIFI|nr:hypothetical protein H6P81_000403 [Aristolochia fimbriata]